MEVTRRSVRVKFGGYSDRGTVNLDLDEEDLFVELAEGVQIMKGGPPKQDYSADHASEFDHDVMLTEEIVGLSKRSHHRYLVVSQRFFQFMKSFRPIDFHFSPIFMK